MTKTQLKVEESLKHSSQDCNIIMNKLKFNSLKATTESIINRNTSFSFFKPTSFEYPTFQSLVEDIGIISLMGNIKDNRSFPSPMVIFNTYNFEMLEYNDDDKEFHRLKTRAENNIQMRIPKYFKSQVISNDEVILLGGSEEIKCDWPNKQVKYETSNKAFKITKGVLNEFQSRMYKARQYFNI